MQLSFTSTPNLNAPNGFTKGRPIILLHGLLGQLSNWKHVKERFEFKHEVFAPELPLFNGLMGNNLDRLVKFLENYISQNQVDQPVLIGNSLGGHIALLYTLKHPNKVAKLVLTGSSGLYENTFGGTFPRVKDYSYIKGKVEDVFDRKEVVDEAMVNHIYEIVQQKSKAISIIGLARDAQKQNLKSQLPQIKVPTLLLWGLQDVVTPPAVAEQFRQLLPQSTLHYINDCGHAPMMEQPELFNLHLSNFLASNYAY